MSLSMFSSLARWREPGMSRDDLGESSNSAFCLFKDELAPVNPARVAFLSLAFCDMVRVGFGTTSCIMLDDLVSGSGEKEGKEVKAGSSSSRDREEALDPCRFGTPLRVLGFLNSAEAWEA
jgi:hypothetical protein